MRHIYLILIFVSVFLSLNKAQETDKKSVKDEFKLAEELFIQGEYEKALPHYEQILYQDPENAMLNYKAGVCAFHSYSSTKNSIAYLKKATENVSEKYDFFSFKEKRAPEDVFLWLGRAYHINYKFKDAIKAYDDMLEHYVKQDEELRAKIESEIDLCKNGIQLIENPVDIIETKLSKGINSEFAEHSPVLSADESVLIFTSKRKGTGNKIAEDGSFFEDIYISKNNNGIWLEPQSIGESINTEWNEATIGLSVDGQTLFIYKDDDYGSIYTSRLEGDIWSAPKKLGNNINTKAKENHASLSANGKILYFTSDRKGGFGGMDIYMSELQSDGKWGKAINLGADINTKEDEATPFIHADEKTLYFSSKGHTSMGGFDIFKTTNEGGKWSKPENVGYPVNTTADDVAFVVTPDFKRAYYSSRRGESLNTDIYMITYVEEVDNPIAIVTGKVKANDQKPIKRVKITVLDSKTKQMITETRANSKTGDYLFILTPGKDYFVLYEADDHLFYSERILLSHDSKFQKLKKPVVLNPVVVGETFQQYKMKFNKGEYEVDEVMDMELDEISKSLKSNKDLVVEIPLPPNNKIAKLRSEAVIENLKKKDVDDTHIVTVASSEDMLSTELLMVVNVLDRKLMSLKEKKYKIEFDKDSLSIDRQSENELENLSGIVKFSKNLQLNISVIEGDKISQVYTNSIVKKLSEAGVPRDKIIINTVSRESVFNNVVMINIIREVDEMKMRQHLLAFKENQYDLTQNLDAQLDEISKSLAENPELMLELSEDPLNELSKNRTQAILRSLANKDIDRSKVRIKQVTSAELAASGVNAEIKIRSQGEYADDGTFIDDNYAYTPGSSRSGATGQNYVEVGVSSSAASGFSDQVLEDISLSSIYFDVNKYVTNDFDNVFGEISNYLGKFNRYQVEIEAYADAQGPAAYNESLSKKRAEFVKDKLIQNGLSPDMIKIVSFGESFPLADNAFFEGRRFNRRVDIKIQSPEGYVYSTDNIELPNYLDMRFTILLKQVKTKLPADYFYQYDGIPNTNVKFLSNSYFYTVGDFKYEEDARQLYHTVIQKHFPDAIVIRNYELDPDSRPEPDYSSSSSSGGGGFGEGPFVIQVLALSRVVENDFFQNLENVSVYFDSNDNLYKYVIGEYSNSSDALTELNNTISKGYPGAFIANKSKFDNSEKIR